MGRGTRIAIVLSLLLPPTAGARADDTPATVAVANAKADANGVLVHAVRSPFQAGTTSIRVLLPDKMDPAKAYAVVYVLPVEARDESRYGDGLLEAKRLGLADRHQAIFVAPTFSHLPWYADHPTDPTIRQESYLLRVVLPFVEQAYPARADAGGRMLVGFSKSGWGAYSLLLRHPDVFGKAAAWDAPLMMDAPGKYGSGPVFGTAANFDAYRVATLLEKRAADLRGDERLVLLGYGNFRDHHLRAHALMASLKVRHAYADGPKRKHEWGSGWLPEAVDRLAPPPPAPRVARSTATRPAPPPRGDGDR
jgi:hypothetical protein